MVEHVTRRHLRSRRRDDANPSKIDAITDDESASRDLAR
jgi:hypothetical protein